MGYFSNLFAICVGRNGISLSGPSYSRTHTLSFFFSSFFSTLCAHVDSGTEVNNWYQGRRTNQVRNALNPIPTAHSSSLL